MTQQQIREAVVDGTLLGMVECDVRVLEELQYYFSEMISDRSCVNMPKNTTFSRSHASCLWVAFVVSRYCSPHHFYLAHGLVAERVYQVIEYEPNPCFQRFGESVSAARRARDEDPDKAIIADTMKTTR